MYTHMRSATCSLFSLGSRPSPYVRVLIARGWANRRAGKAWDDSSRESRTVVGQYLARAPWCRRGTLFSRYQAFLTRCFWQTVEAKSKTSGCWVRRRPLLPSSRMVSFSFSTIDYKSLTYVGGLRPITVFLTDKNSFFRQSDERQPLILR